MIMTTRIWADMTTALNGTVFFFFSLCFDFFFLFWLINCRAVNCEKKAASLTLNEFGDPNQLTN